MTIIETHIDIAHMELIKIFFKANELNVVIDTYYKIVGPGMIERPHIRLTYDSNADTAEKISYMAIVHSGFNNMLDDFLLKCGVPVKQISPISPVGQASDEAFEEHMIKIGLRK